jgi:hypothetical protein
MEITSVKIQQNGWLLNGNISVPNASGNREREAIVAWIAEGNTPEPEFTDAELAKQVLSQKVQDALSFLSSTDYKDLPRYIPKDGEDMNALYAKRDEARVFVRANKL